MCKSGHLCQGHVGIGIGISESGRVEGWVIQDSTQERNGSKSRTTFDGFDAHSCDVTGSAVHGRVVHWRIRHPA
jgi:hypothetical protein